MLGWTNWLSHYSFKVEIMGSSPIPNTYRLCSVMVAYLPVKKVDRVQFPHSLLLVELFESPYYSGDKANWRSNSVGLGLVLKTTGAVKCLGVGTSFLRMIEVIFYITLLLVTFIAAYNEGKEAIDDLFGE